MNGSRGLAVLMLVLAAATAASCRQEAPPAVVDLPPTPFLTSQSLWGVSNRAYTRVFAEKDAHSDVVGHLRRGDVVEIRARVSGAGTGEYWLNVALPDGNGWVGEDDLDLYESRAQAATAGSAMGAEAP